MKLLRLISPLVALLITAGFAYSASTPSVMSSSESAISAVKVVPLFPARDDADEDSVHFEYGFEDGWQEWTTVDLTDPGNKWHSTEFNAFEGNSWWCADPVLGGYDNQWLQFIVTPALDLSDMEVITLRFKAYWSVEQPGGEPEGFDGWDGCNVWISTDGGQQWRVIEPVRPQYQRRSLYSFGYEWNMGQNIPGWVANSGNAQWPAAEWVDAEFNLNQYAGQEDVRIRWAFASDPGWATGGEGDPNRRAYGFFIDNMIITADDDVVWSNNGDEQEDLVFDRPDGVGDNWILTENDSNTGRFSARCQYGENLNNALVTPEIVLPERGWTNWFEFYVRCDLREHDSNEDNYLDDYFMVDLSVDGGMWEQVVYDYARDNTWADMFKYYGPEVHFNTPPAIPEWKWKLNLTQFAGRTIQLRWRVRTDDVRGQSPGTGVYIDDFRLLTINRAQSDVGVDWAYIPYPNSIGQPLSARAGFKNFGLVGHDQVIKYFQIDNGPLGVILPWQRRIEPDSTDVINFRISDRYDAQDSVKVSVFTRLINDEDTSNDTFRVNGVVVYPENIWVLGYDSRTYNFRYEFPTGTGPMVKYTPAADSIRGAFDLKALRVRWDGSQQGDAQTRLHIYADNDGELGEEIHTEMITVQQMHLLPRVHVIDLSNVEALRNMNDDFYVWFEITEDNSYPFPIGDRIVNGMGHFFNYNNEEVVAYNAELQIHAVIVPADFSMRAALPGRQTVDYDTVAPRIDHLQKLLIFNSGTEDLIFQGIELSGSNAFEAYIQMYQGDNLPMTLKMGDAVRINVWLNSAENGLHEAELTVLSNADNVPAVSIRAIVDPSASVNESETLPNEFGLGNAYPNPFNAQTMIPFTLSSNGVVDLAVYDIAGRRISTLVSGRMEAGNHSVTWNAENIPAGVYLYRLSAGNNVSTRKVVLVK